MKWKVLVSLLAFNSLFANSDILNLLERQCKTLPEGEEKQLVVKQLSDKLYNQIQKVMSKNGCEITWDKQNNKIIISKSESDEDLLAGLEDLDTNVDWLDEELKQKQAEMKQKQAEMKRKEAKMNKVELLELMNPTREFSLFARDFDKHWSKQEYDYLLNEAKRVKKATQYPVDKNDYELWINVYKQDIIPKIENKLWEVKDTVVKNKLKELKSVIEYIIKNTKTADIGKA